MYRDYCWVGSYWQIMVMTGLLSKMWHTKDCSGISLKSQKLYALVFMTRHQDLLEPEIPLQNLILKTSYVILSIGILLSMKQYFQKSYEKQNDKARMDIWIVACLLLAWQLVPAFNFLEALTAFSTCLEAVAMIPQFQLIISARRIDKHVILYITEMTIYAILNVAHVVHNVHVCPVGPSLCNYHPTAAAVQLLLYCDFFYQIYPLLTPQHDDDQRGPVNPGFFRKTAARLCSAKAEDVESNIKTEKQLEKGQLASNVSSVVLTPFTLTAAHSDKELQPTVEVIKS